MKTLLFSLFYLYCASCIAEAVESLNDLVYGHSVVVENPVAVKIASLGYATAEPLWRCDVDLNNDGLPDILLSFDHNRNGRAGLMWQVFFAQADGKYLAVPDAITFRPDATTVTKLEGDSVPHLVGYQPGRSERGALIKVVVEGEHIREVLITNEFQPQGKDEAAYKQMFATEKLVHTSDVTKQATQVETVPATEHKPSPPPAPPQTPVIKPSHPLTVEPPVKAVPVTPEVVLTKEQALPETKNKSRLLVLLAVISAAIGLIVILLRRTVK